MSNIGNYEETYRTFQWDVPEFFNFGTDVVDALGRDPSRRALCYLDASRQASWYSFADFAADSSRFANLLQSLGLSRGDRVLLVLPRIPEWQIVMLGILKAGAVAIPSTTMLRPKDIRLRIEAAQACAVVTDTANAEKVEAVRAETPSLRHLILVDGPRAGWIDYASEMEKMADQWTGAPTRSTDPALLYFTSGTVGTPKAVLHNHGYTLTQRVTGQYWLDLREGDLHWNLSDTGWAKAAYSTLFGPWNTGTPVFMYRGDFQPRETLELLSQHPITVFCAPPTAFRMLVKENLSDYRYHLRHVTSAGEPLNPEVIEVWKESTGLDIHDGYGQTETVLLVANFPGIPIKPGSMGRPAPGAQVVIVDPQGQEKGVGEEGEIAVKGNPPSLFRGYWNNPARVSSGGIYRTGDRAYRDQDGYFWFVGRDDDVIISAGYRIGPFEVESALLEHPAVVESAAVASPDADRGHVVKAFVVLRKGYSPSPELIKELQDHVKKVTAPYKYPRRVEFVAELPKTVSGKIRRVELRAREMQGS